MTQNPPPATSVGSQAEFPTLTHAPISEAIISLKCQPSQEIDDATLRAYIADSGSGFELHDIQLQTEGKFESSPSGGMQVSAQQPRWDATRFQADNGRLIVALGKQGMLFSELAPYRHWEAFLEEGLQMWNLYQAYAKPVEITQVGLRYINMIEVPDQRFDIGQIMTLPPRAPEKCNDAYINHFMHQDLLQFGEFKANYLRTLVDSKGLKFVLDIDVLHNKPCDTDIETLTNLLVKMRHIKNRIFFGTLTSEQIERLK